MKHYTTTQLLALVLKGETSEHLDVCAWCTEQYEFGRQYLEYDVDEQGYGPPCRQRSEYRLAAQSSESAQPMFRLRRTWYLGANAAILRVLEDTQRKRLTGFFISEQPPRPGTRIRFDGIDQDFTPDSNGTFEIGAAGIDIEPMNVIILTS